MEKEAEGRRDGVQKNAGRWSANYVENLCLEMV
jgi:hypothetical protein